MPQFLTRAFYVEQLWSYNHFCQILGKKTLCAISSDLSVPTLAHYLQNWLGYIHFCVNSVSCGSHLKSNQIYSVAVNQL